MNPEIIFEDSDLLVLDKPAGLIVHEGHGQTDATLVDWLKTRYPKSPLSEERYGLLHRLDKDTSGLILVAKTLAAFKYYKKLFKQRAITKQYLALVHGRLTPTRGLIQIPLARGLVNRTRFEPATSGRSAETEYNVETYYPQFTYLSVWPKTGRTHQIRVHFASLGHPIVGDKVYGKPDAFTRQFLHAHRLDFIDQKGKNCKFISPLPADLDQFLRNLSR
ncbi:MAG: RluA family pseudouridine synthase [Patescibacteria group bacterium]